MMTGRVIVVVGASGGIGAAAVRRLSNAGAVVAESSGTDLRDPAAPNEIVDRAVTAHGRIDGLVNCAGIQPVANFMDMSEPELTDMVNIDLVAAHRLTAATARAMIESDHGGSIVHVASIEGTRPRPGHSHYAMAKAGLLMHVKAAAIEIGRHGIRVNSVSPGLIDRPGLRDDWPEGVDSWTTTAPLGRVGAGDDVADACLFLLSDMSAWITGTDLVVDGGMTACPAW